MVSAVVLGKVIKHSLCAFDFGRVEVGEVSAGFVAVNKVLTGCLNQAVGVGLTVKRKSVLIRVGEVHAHLVELAPCPFVVGVKLGGIVEAPFFDNSAVVGYNIAEGGVGNYCKVLAGEREVVCNLLNAVPQRVVVIDIIVNLLEHTLYTLHGICSGGTGSRGIEVGSVAGQNKVCQIVKSCRP